MIVFTIGLAVFSIISFYKYRQWKRIVLNMVNETMDEFEMFDSNFNKETKRNEKQVFEKYVLREIHKALGNEKNNDNQRLEEVERIMMAYHTTTVVSQFMKVDEEE